jgi:hypothetical protein
MKLFEIINNLNVSSSVPKLYHLSTSKTLTKLTPKIPRDVVNRRQAFEDNTIPRVSFSESIKGCILGLQLGEKDFLGGKCRFYVYEPTKNSQMISNNELNKHKLIFDSAVTKEWWCLDEVTVQLLGKIEVHEKPYTRVEFTPLRIGNKKFLKPNGKIDTYSYKYKWFSKE